MKVNHLDHLVLTVRDIDATIAFYVQALGMEAIEFATGRRALTFGDSKINLHEVGRELEPRARVATAGSADICLIVEQDIDQVMRGLLEMGVAIEEGPVQRSGATGPIVSCYVRDPDGNLIELSNYTI